MRDFALRFTHVIYMHFFSSTGFVLKFNFGQVHIYQFITCLTYFVFLLFKFVQRQKYHFFKIYFNPVKLCSL